MGLFNSKERFGEFSSPSLYKVVDFTHPLNILMGLNKHGQKSIELKGKYSPVAIKGTKGIGVNVFMTKDNSVITQFSLLDQKAESLFFEFCDDIVDSSREVKSQVEGYSFVVNRYYLWKNMFSTGRKKHLSLEQIMGLLGELLFIKSFCFSRYGFANAILGWSGAEKKHKDFSFANEWYEIKTVSSYGADVTISSLDQLDSEAEGYLVTIIIESMSDEFTSGYNLNTLVIEMLKSIEDFSIKDLFISKLNDYGYSKDDYYNDYNYQYKGYKAYLVSNAFPRLLRKDIDSRITKVKYTISTGSLGEFEREIGSFKGEQQ